MVSKLLLIGQLNDEIRQIQVSLNRNKLYSVERVDDIRTAIQKMKSSIVHLAMIDLHNLSLDKFSITQILRRETYDVPMLILAKSMTPDALEYSKKQSKLVILEKPYEEKDLYGITAKLLSGRDVPQRIHRRFHTQQAAKIEALGAPLIYEGTMLNLSRGGAFLKLKEPVTLGGIVKMSIPLKDLDKTYEVNAKVIWHSNQAHLGEGSQVGLEFIQPKDVYRNLLNNL